MKMSKNIGYRLRDLIEKHDFSLLWSLIIFGSSIVLITQDLPLSIRESLPYNGIVVGLIGIAIFAVKSFGIFYRKFAFHSCVDFLGATWLIFMGEVVSTAVPALFFTGTILFITGGMVNARWIIRFFTRKRW